MCDSADLVTEKFRESLRTLCQIFDSSRLSPKIQTWNSDTIVKIFKWTDIISKLMLSSSSEVKRIGIEEIFPEQKVLKLKVEVSEPSSASPLFQRKNG